MWSTKVSRTPRIIPSRKLNLALPLPVFTKLTAHLYSPLEQRVPFAAYSTFLSDLINSFFSDRRLDLAPFTGGAPGSQLVSGPPETLAVLEQLLKGKV